MNRPLLLRGLRREKPLEDLEGTADFLLGHLRDGIDVFEGSPDAHLPRRDEDTAGDDGVLRLALEDLGVLALLEQMHGHVGNGARQIRHVAQRADRFVGGLEALVALVMNYFVLGSMQIAAAGAAIAECNARLQLRAVKQRVRRLSDARGIVVALVIVRECTPLGTHVDDVRHED